MCKINKNTIAHTTRDTKEICYTKSYRTNDNTYKHVQKTYNIRELLKHKTKTRYNQKHQIQNPLFISEEIKITIQTFTEMSPEFYGPLHML